MVGTKRKKQYAKSFHYHYLIESQLPELLRTPVVNMFCIIYYYYNLHFKAIVG